MKINLGQEIAMWFSVYSGRRLACLEGLQLVGRGRCGAVDTVKLTCSAYSR